MTIAVNPAPEADPLLKAGEKSHTTIMGSEVVDDDEDWHYVMTFNRPKKDEKVEDALELLHEIFTPRILDVWMVEESEWFDTLDDGPVSKADIYKRIWDKVVEILTGESVGMTLGWKPTIDDTQIMLLMKLREPETQVAIADKLHFDMPVKPQAYQVKGLTCPKLAPTIWQKLGCDRHPPLHTPTYLPFETNFAKDFQEDAKARIKQAKEVLKNFEHNFHQKGVRIDSVSFIREARRIMRQVDLRSALMIVLVEALKECEAAAKRDETRLEHLKCIFAYLHGILEEKDVDLRFEMNRRGAGSDEKLYKARLENWSSPQNLSVDEYVSTELYQEFTELDLLRIINLRLSAFIYVKSMEQEGVIEAFFPVHRYEKVKEFAESGWGSINPRSLLKWPGDENNDKIRAYFGEEVGFFFHWLTYCTRLLFWPALLSLLVVAAPLFMDHDQARILREGVGLCFCLWTAYLSMSYAAVMHTHVLMWGMKGRGNDAIQLKDYKPVLRGSFRESFIRISHWIVGLVLVIETVLATFLITKFRAYATENPKETMFSFLGCPVTGTTASKLGVYAITINIKVVNFAWGQISPRMALLENWRTEQLMKDSQVFKMFMVKCIVYYYPFFYLAFIKELVTGCVGSACVDALRENLAVFVITHIATVIVMTALQLGMTAWEERGILKTLKEKGKGTKFTYVQAQANRPVYSGDTDDYMELVIALGFVTMFATVYPFIALLAFLSNLLEIRILSFRMLRVLKRPVPAMQEGIGAWLTIMKALTYMSCIVSVGLVVFTLRPGKSMEKHHQLFYFILAEHAFIGATFLFAQAVPEKSPEDEMAEEKNEHARDLILAGDSNPVKAKKGTAASLVPGYEGVHAGSVVDEA